jgi:hypothetical protein
MRLKLTWPRMASPHLYENFYLGGWHPSETIALDWSDPPPSVRPVCIVGNNWFLASNTSRVHRHEPGLVHAPPASQGKPADAVAFSGYILAPPVHSYSPSQDILSYWLNVSPGEHNGVFSAACVRDSGAVLDLVTDMFGIAPLYYRRLQDLVLFATNPRYLAADGDEPDYRAWRCLVQTGFILGDRTLTKSVLRVPPRHVLRFRGDTIEARPWFDYGGWPDGSRRIDGEAIANFEESFQSALSRCLQLQTPGIVLSLSSGHDSRRILAGLQYRDVPFEALTVRVFQKENRDLDATFASLMAEELGFPHRVIDSSHAVGSRGYAVEFARYDRERQILLASECDYHTWAVPLMHALPESPTIFFDGLAGDVFGNSGFVVPHLHEDPEADRFLIADHAISSEFDGLFRRESLPTADDIRDELIAFIEKLPPGLNQAELAFLLLQTRRAIAIWAQLMVPAGHVVVCPYFDLDHIRVTLAYHPGDKFVMKPQTRCLERFWPLYFAFPGSRAIPPDIPPGPSRLTRLRYVACFRQLQQELLESGAMPEMTRFLGANGRLRFWLARKNGWAGQRLGWAFKQLMELVAQETEKSACWHIVREP